MADSYIGFPGPAFVNLAGKCPDYHQVVLLHPDFRVCKQGIGTGGIIYYSPPFRSFIPRHTNRTFLVFVDQDFFLPRLPTVPMQGSLLPSSGFFSSSFSALFPSRDGPFLKFRCRYCILVFAFISFSPILNYLHQPVTTHGIPLAGGKLVFGDRILVTDLCISAFNACHRILVF